MAQRFPLCGRSSPRSNPAALRARRRKNVFYFLRSSAWRRHLISYVPGVINQPIRMMEHEHATAGEALAEMRRLTKNYTVPEDACNTFRVLFRQLEELESDLHLHVHLENNILFPRAAALERSIQG